MGISSMVAESYIDRRIIEAFSAIDRVEGVYAHRSGDRLAIYTIISEDDEDTYDRIYEQERSLIHDAHDLRFDFNVIARRGRPISGIVGSYVSVWQRSRA